LTAISKDIAKGKSKRTEPAGIRFDESVRGQSDQSLKAGANNFIVKIISD
jgi:hypothetical protein